MPTLALSVVVPTRGGARRLPVLMDALSAQSVPEPWEVLVVVDGDVDGTREVLGRYESRLPLRTIDGPESGVSSALAVGYAAAHGEIVLRCDDDLTPPPGFLAAHLGRHRARPPGSAPLGLISLTVDVFEPDTAYAAAYGRPASDRLRAGAYSRRAEDRWMHWAACNSVPRTAYLRAGGFDTSLTYREDSDLGLRLARAGVEIVIDPELELEHRGPARDTSTRAARAFTSGASLNAFEDRHPGAQPVRDRRRTSAWDIAVGLGARRIDSHEGAAALGHTVDRALGRLPLAIRTKSVSWAVEAAGEAGRRVGDARWRRDPPDTPVTTVSVVIPHHGDPTQTLALVEQLARQSCAVEVVVADDASPVPFPPTPGVRVVRRDVNGGFGANVNSGAAVATGDALLVLNSDLSIDETFVEDMKAAAERHPGCVLSPRVVDEVGEEAWVGRRFPRLRHEVSAWLTPLAAFRHTDAWHRAVGHDVRARGHESVVDWVVGAAIWIPMRAFEDVGGFDERFFMNSEEVDLQRRLRQRGTRAVALRHPVAIHAGGGSSPSNVRRRWLVEGQLSYADKWGSRRRLQLALTASTAVNFAVNTVRRAAGRSLRPVQLARTELSMIWRRR